MTSITEKLSFFLVLFVVILSPYYRGIYPDYYKLPFLSLIFLAFLIYLLAMVRKKERFFHLNLPEMVFFLIAIVYFVTIVVASSKYSSVIVFIGYIAWAFLFWLILELFQKKELKMFLIQTIVYNAGILSLLAIFDAFRFIPERFQNFLGMSIWGLYFSGRLATTFQYQNTSASFFAVCLFLGIFMYLQEKNCWKKLINGVLLFLIFFGFLFAFSRGTNLTFLITLLFLFILVRKKEYITSVILILSSLFLPSIFLQIELDRCLSQALPFNFLILFLIGLSSFFLLSFLFLPHQQISLEKKINKKLVFFLILLIIFGIECFFVFFVQFDTKNFTFVRGFGEKGRDISFETKNVIYRFTFYHDALKMIQKKPLLGWGGGGWAARYFSFQSHTYYTKFPHSFYLNTLVESGILGLVPLLFLLFYSLRICIISTDRNQSISIVPYLGAGVFLIFLHSSIDLNFAMGAYHIFAWTVLGLLLNSYPIQKRKLSIPFIIPILSTLFFFILSIFWGNAEYYYQLGNKYRATNDLIHSAEAWEKTVRLNPWHDNALYQLSNLCSDIYLKTKKEEFLQLAMEKNQKALAIEPFNYEYFRQKADLLLLKGEFAEAWSNYSFSIELAPMVLGNYEKILFAFLNLLNSQHKTMDPNAINQIKVYTDTVYNLYFENQLKSTQSNPPSKALNFLKRDIDKVIGGGSAINSITED
ncbi:MAG: hypothetical protein GX428_07805 [Candidatus Atribacteria bacterium]|nr:hypothetical protein [Candidatus Atribacteria bacterium]